VQLACAKLLTAIDEPDFLDGSDGYRPGRGALEAVRDRTFDRQDGMYGYVVEADVKGFFDPLDPTRLLTMLRERIADRAFLRLIRKGLKAGMLETDGLVVPPETGSPQGGCLSPVLANVYVHDALDRWLDTVVKPHGRGAARWCRDADDGVCAFRSQDDAERFYRALPQRVAPFNLQVAPDKTPLRRFSRVHPSLRRRFTCLGFARYWMPDRPGVPRVKRRTARQKLQAACRRITAWIKQPRHLPGRAFYRQLNSRLRGHDNDSGLHGNSRSLYRFVARAMRCTFKWRNRRGGKRQSVTWEQFAQAWDRRGIARPRITEVKQRRVFA
jgi:hypothetical protein